MSLQDDPFDAESETFWPEFMYVAAFARINHFKGIDQVEGINGSITAFGDRFTGGDPGFTLEILRFFMNCYNTTRETGEKCTLRHTQKSQEIEPSKEHRKMNEEI